MRKIALFAVAMATVGASFTGVSYAGEPVDGPSGFLCGFSSISNPTAEPGTQTGEIDGGPLVIVDAEGNTGEGTLTCTIQVNQGTHAGTGVSVSGQSTNSVVVIPPSVVSYQAGEEDVVFLCTEFDPGAPGGNDSLYFHSSNDPAVEGHWSLDPTSACAQATSAGGGDIFDPIEPVILLLDTIICIPLAILFPPEGDIPNVWDCPPYQS